MENNNNGKGIFYGVIGVATLIVAIIGATFAYFTATAGDNSVINITSYDTNFSVSLALTKEAPIVSVNNLIPLTDTYVDTALAHVDGESNSQPCIDNNGNQVCALYKLHLINSGGAVTLVGNLSAEVNTFTPSNLKYRLYTYADSTYTALGTDVAIVPSVGAGVSNFFFSASDNSATSFDMADGTTINTTADYYLVIWLSDIGDEQNDDLGKTFTGRVTFNAAGESSSTIQATFNS